jgi:hypothetical protein
MTLKWNTFEPEEPETEDVYRAYRDWNDPDFGNPEAQEAWLKANREEFEMWMNTIQAAAFEEGRVAALDWACLHPSDRAKISIENPHEKKQAEAAAPQQSALKARCGLVVDHASHEFYDVEIEAQVGCDGVVKY